MKTCAVKSALPFRVKQQLVYGTDFLTASCIFHTHSQSLYDGRLHSGMSLIMNKLCRLLYKLMELFIWMCVFYRLESRMSADIGVIMQLLQRQIPMIPPSYSTLTSTSHTLPSPILYPTAASPTDKSPTTNLHQQQYNKNQDEVLQQLPESNSHDCGSSVLHFSTSLPLIHASALHTSSYQSLFCSPSLPQRTSTSPPMPQTSTQYSSSVLPQTRNQCVSSLHSLSLPLPLTTLTPLLPEKLKHVALTARTRSLGSVSQVL